MIHPDLFPFFRKLDRNNSKDWFNPRKAEYKAMHQVFAEALEEFSVDVAGFDPLVERHLDNKGAVKTFRIYRDTRFQKSPVPLKTNISGLITGGEEGPFYYIQAGPGDSIAGGGFHLPSPRLLTAIREEIAETHPELEALLADSEFRSMFPEGLDTDYQVKTAPRGFSKNHPAIVHLRKKSFTAIRRFTDEEATAPDFPNLLLDTFQTLYPLNRYLARAFGRLEG